MKNHEPLEEKIVITHNGLGEHRGMTNDQTMSGTGTTSNLTNYINTNPSNDTNVNHKTMVTMWILKQP